MRVSPCGCGSPFLLFTNSPPQNGTQVSSKKQKLGPGLGALKFRKLCKGPGAGVVPRTGAHSTARPPRLAALGGRTWGRLPAKRARGSPGPPPWARPSSRASLTAHPSGPPLRRSGGTPAAPPPSGAGPRARAAPGGRRRRHRAIASRRHLAPEPQAGTTWGPRMGDSEAAESGGDGAGVRRGERVLARSRKHQTSPPTPAAPITGKKEWGGCARGERV